jgi:transposase-like protein
MNSSFKLRINAAIVSLEATMATPTANKKRKLQSYTLDFKLKILTEVDKKDRSKTDICKEYGLANSTLATFIKIREKIESATQESTFQSDREKM